MATPSSAGLPESRVLIIGTGGTICMQEGPDGLQPSGDFLESAMAPRPTFNDMSTPRVTLPAVHKGKQISIPSLRTPPTAYQRHVRYGIVEFSPLLDSSSMNAQDWADIAISVKENYHLYDGFVILHGTDSLAYTASALSFIMSNLGKPVILTGSQAPIFALQSDAVGNLLGSLIIAGTFVIPEVGLFFHHKLYRGNRTTKVSAASFEAFASPNCEPLAKVNGLGIEVNWPLTFRPTTIAEFDILANIDTTHVACLRVFPGIKPEMVDAVLRLPDLRGLILETFGMGNVPGGSDGQLTRVLRATPSTAASSSSTSPSASQVSSPRLRRGHPARPRGSHLRPRPHRRGRPHQALLPPRPPQPLQGRHHRPPLPLHPRRDDRDPAHDLLPPGQLHRRRRRQALPAEAAFAALGYAIQQDNIEAVLDLLDGDGRNLIKQADYAGNTAIHLVAVSGNADIMRALLQRGASVHERNRANISPLLLATLSGNDACAQLLRTAGAHMSSEELERKLSN
uniref:asparaginase n=1 Tax=Bionectria ochroleuca TaxID=29856 RepID=A0A8H7TSZ6_BIOOC